MNNLICIILTAVMIYILGLFLPWWSIALPCFASGILFNKKTIVHGFLGFIAVFIVWFLLASIAQQSNAKELSIMIGNLFGGLDSIMLVFLAGVIGGLYGFLAQISGSLLGKIIKK